MRKAQRNTENQASGGGHAKTDREEKEKVRQKAANEGEAGLIFQPGSGGRDVWINRK